MVKENNKTVMILVTLAIAIILVGALIASISDETQKKTTKTTVTETVNIAPARLADNNINATYYFHLDHGCPHATSWRNDLGSECEISNDGIQNSTGGTLSDPTDVVFVSNGTVCSGYASGDLHFVNSTGLVNTASNTTTVTYSYCASDYMSSSWGKSLLNLVPGLLAVGLLVAVVGGAYLLLGKKEED